MPEHQTQTFVNPFGPTTVLACSSACSTPGCGDCAAPPPAAQPPPAAPPPPPQQPKAPRPPRKSTSFIPPPESAAGSAPKPVAYPHVSERLEADTTAAPKLKRKRMPFKDTVRGKGKASAQPDYLANLPPPECRAKKCKFACCTVMKPHADARAHEADLRARCAAAYHRLGSDGEDYYLMLGMRPKFLSKAEDRDWNRRRKKQLVPKEQRGRCKWCNTVEGLDKGMRNHSFTEKKCVRYADGEKWRQENPPSAWSTGSRTLILPYQHPCVSLHSTTSRSTR